MSDVVVAKFWKSGWEIKSKTPILKRWILIGKDVLANEGCRGNEDHR